MPFENILNAGCLGATLIVLGIVSKREYKIEPEEMTLKTLKIEMTLKGLITIAGGDA
jgi:hypothetical protein